jgi:hypothetical protein
VNLDLHVLVLEMGGRPTKSKKNQKGNMFDPELEHPETTDQDTEAAREQMAMSIAASHKPPDPTNKPDGVPDASIQVNVTATYKAVWGKRRLAYCYFTVLINFTGDLFQTHGSSEPWIENVTITGPGSHSSWNYVGSEGFFCPSQPLFHPPWQIEIGCMPISMMIPFRINTKCGHSYDFQFPIKGTPFSSSHYDPGPIAQPYVPPATYSLQVKTPKLRGKKAVYLMKGSYSTDQYSEYPKYQGVEFKLITEAGDPTKVLSSYVDLVPAPCKSKRTSSGFSLTWKAPTREYTGDWIGDVFTCKWGSSGTGCQAHVTCSIIENEHVLNAIRDLPTKALGTLLHSVAQQVFDDDNPAYIDFWRHSTSASEEMNQLGVTSHQDQAELLGLLKKMIIIHTRFANWTGENVDSKNPHPSQGKTIQEILSNMNDLPDIKYVTPQIVKELIMWEDLSSSTLSSRRSYEEQMKDEKKHFYCADRIHWLLVQRQHDVLKTFPKEVVKKIAKMLPRVSHGCLHFHSHFYESHGCAGSTQYDEMLSFFPKDKKVEFWSSRKNGRKLMVDYRIEGTKLILDEKECSAEWITRPITIHRDMARGIWFQGQTNKFWQMKKEEMDRVYASAR